MTMIKLIFGFKKNKNREKVHFQRGTYLIEANKAKNLLSIILNDGNLFLNSYDSEVQVCICSYVIEWLIIFIKITILFINLFAVSSFGKRSDFGDFIKNSKNIEIILKFFKLLILTCVSI